MGDKNNDQSVMDKSMRSVFVGNIPYEATEEKLKEIFSEVGPVISLKLVFDRESGKPKGYGFCEYKDQETALSAMRNLNGYEIGGRTLRVDNACTEKSRMEMQQLLQGPQVENPYGDHCDPENAPEIITKTVASLPPEQMYELMKQMKLCIQNNPNEARQMLMVNPQLAYALLQAQVVMRIVDPQQALSMLFKANQMPPVLNTNPVTGQPQQQISPMSIPPSQNLNHNNMPTMTSMSSMLNNNFGPMGGQDVDLRGVVDPRMSRNLDLDMRGGIPNPVPNPMDSNFPRNPRQMHPPQPVMPPFQTSGNMGPGGGVGPNLGGANLNTMNDPRQRGGDPRLRQVGGNPGPGPIPSIQQPSSQQQAANRLTAANGIPNDASDQEKAALIMQVLQLSDEQIAMLPPEQRASILVLKEQIAKSTQR